MSDTGAVVQRLADFFVKNSSLGLWLLEFGATHQRGRLRITRRGVTDWVELTFTGCSYICGSPLGGPYNLRIELSQEAQEIVISGNGEQFVLKCSRMEIDKAYGEYCQLFFDPNN